MISAFNALIFQELASLVPPDILQDAKYIGLNRSNMVQSLITLSCELQDALRKRGEFGRAVAVAQHLAPKIQGVATLLQPPPQPPVEQKRGRDEEELSEEENFSEELESKKAKPDSFQHGFDLMGAALPVFPNLSYQPGSTSISQQSDVSMNSAPACIDEATQRIASLLEHPKAVNALLRFSIDITLYPPHEAINRIEETVRLCLQRLPGILLPCLPSNLSASPDFITAFFDNIYLQGIITVLDRLCAAGSSTAGHVLYAVHATANQDPSKAILQAFHLASEQRAAILQEIKEDTYHLVFRIDAFPFFPHYFAELFSK